MQCKESTGNGGMKGIPWEKQWEEMWRKLRIFYKICSIYHWWLTPISTLTSNKCGWYWSQRACSNNLSKCSERGYLCMFQLSILIADRNTQAMSSQASTIGTPGTDKSSCPNWTTCASVLPSCFQFMLKCI